jgi:hypothetical protein
MTYLLCNCTGRKNDNLGIAASSADRRIFGESLQKVRRGAARPKKKWRRKAPFLVADRRLLLLAALVLLRTQLILLTLALLHSLLA